MNGKLANPGRKQTMSPPPPDRTAHTSRYTALRLASKLQFKSLGGEVVEKE